MCERTYFYIDSRQRSSGSVSEPYVAFSSERKIIKGQKLKVSSVTFPYSFYQFTSSNNTLTITESGQAAHSVTITPSTYTAYTLETELKTILDAGTSDGRTYTVTYDIDTNTYTIDIDIGTFIIDSTSSAAEALGFGTTSATAASLTSDQAVNLTPVDYLLLCSSSFGSLRQNSMKTNIHNTNGKHNVLCKIPLDGNYLDMITYHNLSGEGEFIVRDNISKTNHDFYFISPNGTVIDFRGVYFSLVVALY